MIMRSPLIAISLGAVLSGCAPHGTGGSGSAAVATVRDVTGREIGILTVAEVPGGLLTTGALQGLAPGIHGIHLHATARCVPPFESAGAHWNPIGRQHGFENPQGPHAGDMQNITVNADGSAVVRVSTRGGTLHGTGGLLDGDGAAVVIHEQADDYRTDPSGNSGPRVACGELAGR
jgi:Cu-Zn family superoxide dismutase